MSAGERDQRQWLRLSTAAALLDMPESTLRRLCLHGRVPARKVGHCWRISAAYVRPAGRET